MKKETKPDQRRMALISPEGTRIIGTLERLSGRAEIVPDSFRANPQGGFTFEYEGTTEVFWDGQETDVRDGERVFLDEEGNEFTENTLRLVEPCKILGSGIYCSSTRACGAMRLAGMMLPGNGVYVEGSMIFLESWLKLPPRSATLGTTLLKAVPWRRRVP